MRRVEGRGGDRNDACGLLIQPLSLPRQASYVPLAHERTQAARFGILEANGGAEFCAEQFATPLTGGAALAAAVNAGCATDRGAVVVALAGSLVGAAAGGATDIAGAALAVEAGSPSQVPQITT